jgi:hypothetical protein
MELVENKTELDVESTEEKEKSERLIQTFHDKMLEVGINEKTGEKIYMYEGVNFKADYEKLIINKGGIIHCKNCHQDHIKGIGRKCTAKYCKIDGLYDEDNGCGHSELNSFCHYNESCQQYYGFEKYMDNFEYLKLWLLKILGEKKLDILKTKDEIKDAVSDTMQKYYFSKFSKCDGECCLEHVFKQINLYYP